MALIQAYRILDQRRFILQPLIRDEEIKTALANKFQDTPGARAYNDLVLFLAQDILRDIARLYLDKGEKTASLTNLHRKASEGRVNAALRMKFRQLPDKWHVSPLKINGLTEEQSLRIKEEWRGKDKEEFEASFDKGWRVVSKAINDIKIDDFTKKVITFRDKYSAHLEMTPLGEEPAPFLISELNITYNDIFEFLDKYKESVFELARILTGNVHDVDGFSLIHKDSGEDMWCILSGVEGREFE